MSHPKHMIADEDVIFHQNDKRAIIPKRHSNGAAGYDIFSIQEDSIAPHTMKLVKTGFSLDFPSKLMGYICGRSGLAIKNGIEVVNSYAKNKEEVEVYLYNTSDTAFHFEQGTRIAQLVSIKYFSLLFFYF